MAREDDIIARVIDSDEKSGVMKWSLEDDLPGDRVTEILPNKLWAWVRNPFDSGSSWAMITFFEFNGSSSDSTDVELSHLFTIEGPTGQRQGRHTFFGENFDGYQFYLDFDNMHAALKFLENYFDGD
jgi:hypothetical protein